MTNRIPDHIALCTATDLPAEDGAPEWVHLIPTLQGELSTFDGRGPYVMRDADAVIQTSMANPRGMPIDENHATDLAAPKGGPSPARGWIVELQARADGIWGRVDWTDEGRALVTGKAYRGLSPVLAVSKADRKTVAGVLRASLVNAPNLRGLTALHQESLMDFMKKLAAALGLPETASEDEIMGAVTALISDDAKELQSALSEVGIALGLEGTADASAVAAAAKTLGKDAVVALQAQLSEVTTELNTLRDEGKRAKATAFVDGAITEGRVGVKPLRDHYITRHMSEPTSVEKELAALPKIDGPVIQTQKPAATDGTITELNAEQAAVAEQLGYSHKEFIVQLNAETKKETV